jgi:hypothetical protein
MSDLYRRILDLETRLDRLIASLQLPPKSNHAATTAPGIGDDAGDGYQAGSLWTDTTANEAYICVDPALGAAVWVQIT